jgi:hypothetical protein
VQHLRGGRQAWSCDDSVARVAPNDARLLLMVHRDDAGGGAALVTAATTHPYHIARLAAWASRNARALALGGSDP